MPSFDDPIQMRATTFKKYMQCNDKNKEQEKDMHGSYANSSGNQPRIRVVCQPQHVILYLILNFFLSQTILDLAKYILKSGLEKLQKINNFMSVGESYRCCRNGKKKAYQSQMNE
jgi:hypothetical protein